MMSYITDLTHAYLATIHRRPLVKSTVPSESTLSSLLLETIFMATDICDNLGEGATKRLEYIYDMMYDELPLLEAAFLSLRKAMAHAVQAIPHSDTTNSLWLKIWQCAPKHGPSSENDARLVMCEHARLIVAKARAATIKTLSAFEDVEVLSLYKTMRGAYVADRQQGVRSAVGSWICQTPKRDRTIAAIDQQTAQSFELLKKSRFLTAKMGDVDVRAPEDEGDAYTIDGETFSFHSARGLLMREPGRYDGIMAKGTLDDRMAEAAYKRLMGNEGRPDSDAVGRYIVAQRTWLDREAIFEFFAHTERMAMLDKIRPKQTAEATGPADNEEKRKKKTVLPPQQERAHLKPHERLFKNEADYMEVRRRMMAVMAYVEAHNNKIQSIGGQTMSATKVVIAAFFALCLDKVLVEMPPKKTWHSFLSDECGIKEPQLQSVRTLNDEMNKVADGAPSVVTISKCLKSSPKWRDFVETFRNLYNET